LIAIHLSPIFALFITLVTSPQERSDGARVQFVPYETRGHRVKPGQRARDGKHLLLYQYENCVEGGEVALKTDYGIFVLNEREPDAKHPQPLFILADRRKQRVQQFTSITEFIHTLASLPRGTKLYEYDHCTDTASRGLPASTWPRIRRACRKAHVRIMNEIIRTCICGF
jgi:hypothetical protein